MLPKTSGLVTESLELTAKAIKLRPPCLPRGPNLVTGPVPPRPNEGICIVRRIRFPNRPRAAIIVLAVALATVATMTTAASSHPASGVGSCTIKGVVALGEAEARETVNPRFGQIARASSSKAAATRRVAASSTPSS
jgi:hypothetical protein